ncbi:hypothetical protein LWI28_026250 [Acer negundo]|uniref:Uncharacterized protein n=1 Tax=Acer negundo TaxID=4023 RepID=A0AAD5NXU4_ACENE|nr:hypothetical protein LWI28_026250 [Acer negundo]
MDIFSIKVWLGNEVYDVGECYFEHISLITLTRAMIDALNGQDEVPNDDCIVWVQLPWSGERVQVNSDIELVDYYRVFEDHGLDTIVFKLENVYVPNHPGDEEPEVLAQDGGYQPLGWHDLEAELLNYDFDSEKDDDKDNEKGEESEAGERRVVITEDTMAADTMAEDTMVADTMAADTMAATVDTRRVVITEDTMAADTMAEDTMVADTMAADTMAATVDTRRVVITEDTMAADTMAEDTMVADTMAADTMAATVDTRRVVITEDTMAADTMAEDTMVADTMAADTMAADTMAATVDTLVVSPFDSKRLGRRKELGSFGRGKVKEVGLNLNCKGIRYAIEVGIVSESNKFLKAVDSIEVFSVAHEVTLSSDSMGRNEKMVQVTMEVENSF